MRFGRLPHDPVALAAAPALMSVRLAGPMPPPGLDRSHIAYQPRMFSNDVLPDCTAAGLANAALAVSALAGFQCAIDDALVPAFYAGCVGCGPTEADMAASDGAVVLDVLTRQATQGFDVGDQVPLVALNGTLPLNRIAIATCMADLGVAYLGIDIYERDMDSVSAGDVLDDDGRDPGALLGGHCVVVWDYRGLGDTSTGRIATWGKLQPFTWRWMKSRLREAHGLYWRQLAPAMASAVDKDRLAAEAEGPQPSAA